MKKIVRRISWGLLIGIVCLSGLLFYLRWATDYLNKGAVFFESYLTKQLNKQVTIKALHVSLGILHPSILFEGITVEDPTELPTPSIFKLDGKALRIQINLLPSLWHRKLITREIILEGAQINLPIVPLKATSSPNNFIAQIFSQRHWTFLNSKIFFQENPTVPFYLKAVEITNHAKHHLVRGKGKLGEVGNFTLSSHLVGGKHHLNKLTGTLDLQGTHLQLKLIQAWMKHLSKGSLTLPEGGIAFNLHGELAQNQWQFKGKFQGHDMGLHYDHTHLVLTKIRGLFQWKSLEDSWIESEFENARLSDENHQWEIQHINGKLKSMAGLHHGYLNSEDLQVNLKGWSAPLKNLKLQSEWQLTRNNGILQLTLLEGVIQQNKSQAKLAGTLQFTPAGAVINSKGSWITEKIDQQTWHNYLPTLWLSPDLANWLDHAVEGVGPTTAHFGLQGDLNQFPFDKVGKLELDIHYQDLILNYSPEWPKLEKAEGLITLRNRALLIAVNKAKLNELNIQQLEARINDLGKRKTPLLIINSEGKGSLEQGLIVLKNSPLQDKVAGLMQAITVTGPMTLKLGLKIPLSPDRTEVLGNVQFQRSQLNIPEEKIKLNNLQGKINFTTDTLQANAIQGEWEGNKVKINIDTLSHPHQPLTKIEVASEGLERLLTAKLTPIGLNKFITAAKPIPFNVKLLLTKMGLNFLQIQSSLQGLAVHLPPPFQKSAESINQSELSLNFAAGKLSKVGFNFSSLLNGILAFDPSTGQFDKGAIITGDQTPSLPVKKHQLTVEGKLTQVKAADWWPLFLALKNHITTSDLQTHLSLMIEHLNLWQENFTHLFLTGDHLKSGWQFQVDSQTMKGEIILPVSTNPLQLNLAYLYVSPPTMSQAKQSNLVSALPLASMPSLDFSCEDFHLGNRRFGRLRLVMSPHANNSMAIDWLSSDTKYYNLLAQGEWSTQGSHLMGEIKLFDIADTLRSWQLTDNIHGKKGSVHFDLNWPQGLFSFTLPALQGNIDVQLGEGRIEGLSSDTEQKLDMGRLLTLFNLRSIPKRLTLDFSDLTHDGLSYDELKGNFNLNKGLLFTDNAYLDGSVTRVEMQGEVNILQQSYDLLFSVVPHYTSSLPLVAAIAGGPIAGLATWVVDKALSHEVNRMVTHLYKVQGPWQNPTIESIREENTL